MIEAVRTDTINYIPHQNSTNPMRDFTTAIFSILNVAFSSGSSIPTKNILTEPIISVDSLKPSISIQSKDGMFACSTSSNYLKITDNIKRLDEIFALPNNWDGYGATSFSKSLIEDVKQLIHTLSVQPDIFPTLRNSIQLEYENDKNEYLEFELFDRDNINCYFNDHKGHSIVKKSMMVEVNTIVNNFYTK